MPVNFIGQSHLLQAIGWGILNSLWQAPVCWGAYIIITTGKDKVSSRVKHNLSLFCLFILFCWFVFTIINYYFQLYKVGDFIFLIIPDIVEKINIILPFISVLYVLLLAYLFLQFIKQSLSLYPLRNSQLFKAPLTTRLFTNQVALHMGIKKNVSIWLSANVEVPSVTGFFKPVILLPFSLLNQLTLKQAEAIIIHELAHIKRNDYLINFIQLIAELVLFFNPFARLLGNIARQERENCCDDWVINYQYNKHEYAEALLLIEQQRTQSMILAIAATNGKKKLLKRVKRICCTSPVSCNSSGQQFKIFAKGMVIILSTFLIQPKFYLPSDQIKAPHFSKASIIPKQLIAYNAETPVFYLNTKPLKSISKKIKKTTSNKLYLSPNAEPANQNYSVAVINEELLSKQVEIENLSRLISQKTETISAELYLKVEEEISGNKQKKLYYLQLKNDNGVTTLKPLAIISTPIPLYKVKARKPLKAVGKKRVTA